jgi:hypothetical protein
MDEAPRRRVPIDVCGLETGALELAPTVWENVEPVCVRDCVDRDDTDDDNEFVRPCCLGPPLGILDVAFAAVVGSAIQISTTPK